MTRFVISYIRAGSTVSCTRGNMTIQEKNRQLEILKKHWRFQIAICSDPPHSLLVDRFFSCFEEVFDVQQILGVINSPNGLDEPSMSLALQKALKTDYERDVPSWFLEKGYPRLVVDATGGQVEIGEFQQYLGRKLFEDYSPEEKTELTLYNFSRKSLYIYIGALEKAIRGCVQESLRSQEQRGGRKMAGEIEESDVEDLDSAAKAGFDPQSLDKGERGKLIGVALSGQRSGIGVRKIVARMGKTKAPCPSDHYETFRDWYKEGSQSFYKFLFRLRGEGKEWEKATDQRIPNDYCEKYRR